MQALGWQWREDGPLRQNWDNYEVEAGNHNDYDWVGLRLGKVSDWTEYFMGPISKIPSTLKQLSEQLGK